MPGCSFSLPSLPASLPAVLYRVFLGTSVRHHLASRSETLISEYSRKPCGYIRSRGESSRVPSRGKIVRARARIRDAIRCVPVNCNGVEFPRVGCGILATGRSGACVLSPAITSRAIIAAVIAAQLMRRLLRHW